MTAAEYAPAELVPAHPSNYRITHRQPSDVAHIIIHITDGRGRARAVAEMWQEPRHRSSAHFVIGQDGSVLQAVSVRDVAHHAHAANRSSVGIEHCARQPSEPAFGKGDPGLPVSNAQYAASARLVAWLCLTCALSPDRSIIVGHCEVDPFTTHTDCPNSIWDWDRYMALVAAEYAALAPPHP